MNSSTSILLQISSNTFYILCLFVLVSITILYVELISCVTTNRKNHKKIEKIYKNLPPMPPKLPIIGNLANLNGYDVPYKAFTDLREKYGNIISLQLGNVPAIVVNGIENIREVLITKTSHFDSRPNFRRYHQLFSGNKENSLAFCDWSDLHKFRRDLLIPHTFPRNFSNQFNKLNQTIIEQMQSMLQQINIKSNEQHDVEIKPFLLKSCANIFMQYFCSYQFKYDNMEFNKMIENFDKIFYEVNQGYAADFLPFLLPLHRNNLKKMEKWSHEIRDIIIKYVIEKHIVKADNENDNDGGDDDDDYVTGFLKHINENRQPNFDMNTALFALEDIIGGHSAIGNFLTKVISFLIENPHVQEKIQQEIDTVLSDNIDKDTIVIDLTYRTQMQYTQAVIMEALRLIASPIVPHVSNQDTTVSGFDVKENTLIFLNNYELSMSPKLWTNPEVFEPERFIKDSVLIKPDFFLPFGAGRRSCMGYKLVQFISFTTIANLLKNYTIKSIKNENYKIQIGSLATPEKSFKIQLIKRY